MILIESKSSEFKQDLIDYLNMTGYKTYADRLVYYKFILADVYRNYPCEVAFMIPETGEIVLNPSLANLPDYLGGRNYSLKQCSVAVRHELLHFLLYHQQR